MKKTCIYFQDGGRQYQLSLRALKNFKISTVRPDIEPPKNRINYTEKIKLLIKILLGEDTQIDKDQSADEPIVLTFDRITQVLHNIFNKNLPALPEHLSWINTFCENHPGTAVHLLLDIVSLMARDEKLLQNDITLEKALDEYLDTVDFVYQQLAKIAFYEECEPAASISFKKLFKIRYLDRRNKHFFYFSEQGDLHHLNPMILTAGEVLHDYRRFIETLSSMAYEMPIFAGQDSVFTAQTLVHFCEKNKEEVYCKEHSSYDYSVRLDLYWAPGAVIHPPPEAASTFNSIAKLISQFVPTEKKLRKDLSNILLICWAPKEKTPVNLSEPNLPAVATDIKIRPETQEGHLDDYLITCPSEEAASVIQQRLRDLSFYCNPYSFHSRDSNVLRLHSCYLAVNELNLLMSQFVNETSPQLLQAQLYSQAPSSTVAEKEAFSSAVDNENSTKTTTLLTPNFTDMARAKGGPFFTRLPSAEQPEANNHDSRDLNSPTPSIGSVD